MIKSFVMKPIAQFAKLKYFFASGVPTKPGGAVASSSTARSGNNSYTYYSRMGYGVIALSFGVGGIWAAFAPLDSAAIAPGSVTAESNRKPIQHLEGGIVSAVLVTESQEVKKGDVLFRLDPVKFKANARMLSAQLETTIARWSRHFAEREGRKEITWPDELLAARTPATTSVMDSEDRLFNERRTSLQGQTGVLNSRIQQSNQEIEGLQRQRESYESQAKSIESDLVRLRKLRKKSLYPLTKLQSIEREKTKYEGEAGRAAADIARANERIGESKLRIIQLKQEFTEAAAQELGETESRIAELRQKLRVAEDALARVEVRAPHDGIVQSINVHAAGAVVAPGDALAEIVPSRDALLISARVSPLDIDNVSPKQRAEVRFPAFSGRNLPSIYGHVATISADTMTDEVTNEPYYLGRIMVPPKDLPKSISRKLVSGMPAEVLISTGERTALEYLLSPLTKMLSTTMREQ
jgi:membrane fusion protein, type I secretion system